jgi:hypothetical protein
MQQHHRSRFRRSPEVLVALSADQGSMDRGSRFSGREQIPSNFRLRFCTPSDRIGVLRLARMVAFPSHWTSKPPMIRHHAFGCAVEIRFTGRCVRYGRALRRADVRHFFGAFRLTSMPKGRDPFMGTTLCAFPAWPFERQQPLVSQHPPAPVSGSSGRGGSLRGGSTERTVCRRSSGPSCSARRLMKQASLGAGLVLTAPTATAMRWTDANPSSSFSSEGSLGHQGTGALNWSTSRRACDDRAL